MLELVPERTNLVISSSIFPAVIAQVSLIYDCLNSNRACCFSVCEQQFLDGELSASGYAECIFKHLVDLDAVDLPLRE